MSRSVLRLRKKPHIQPDRQGETIVAVERDGEVVATIYGSQEGVHIVSGRVTSNAPFVMEKSNIMPEPSLVVPLLGADELCPWCHNTRNIEHLVGHPTECPTCRGREQ